MYDEHPLEVKLLFIDFCKYTAYQHSIINNTKGSLNEMDNTEASKEMCCEESLVCPFVLLRGFLPSHNTVAGEVMSILTNEH